MRRFILFPLFLLLTLFSATPSFAQLPKLDALLKGLEDKNQFYGSVLVQRSGTVVFQGACGLHEPPDPTQKNAPDSVYYLSQCSEIFCGALTMMAVDRGLLALAAPIGTYIPAFRDKPGPRVRDLLSHASGLAQRFIHAGDKPRTKADTASWAAEDGLAFLPGSRSTFCPSDFDILGYALELVTGKPYLQLLSEWILTPLGLRQTGLGRFSEGNRNLAQVPVQGQWDFWLSKFKDGSPTSDMYSSTVDLAVFLEALATGRLVQQTTFDLMRTGVVPDGNVSNGKGKGQVGLGFFITPSGAIFDQGRLGVNDNEITGYHALAFHDPRYHLTIILLANRWRPIPDDRALGVVVPLVYADLGLAE